MPNGDEPTWGYQIAIYNFKPDIVSPIKKKICQQAFAINVCISL